MSFAQMVHDLSNQLTVMVACADSIAWLVPRGVADAEINELRACLERASALLRALVVAPPPAPAARGIVDLNTVIGSAEHTLARVTRERIALRLRRSQAPLPVRAEAADIQRVLLNLALNAMEAMAGVGVLTIETAFADDPTPRAVLTVTDTGAGMAPELQARIFQPYFSTRETGMGLGLSLVALTVRQLRGTIAVDSQPGRGTSIVVTLPITTK
jgi:signal transduction histidine kinase